MHTRVTRKEEVASHFCCCQRLNRSQDYLSIQHCKCGSCSISMGLLVIRAVFWTVTLLPGLALQQTAVPGSVSTIPKDVPKMSSIPKNSLPGATQEAMSVADGVPPRVRKGQPSKGISASPQDPQAAIASPQTIPTTVAPPQLPQGTNPQPYTLQVMYQPIPLPQVVYQAPQYNPASLFAPPVVYYLPPPSMVVEPTVLSPANRNQGLAGHRNTVSTSGSSTLPKSPAEAQHLKQAVLPQKSETVPREHLHPQGRQIEVPLHLPLKGELLQPAAQQMARASGVAQYYEAHGCLDPPAVHALALTRGCTSSHAQRACEAIGHVGAEGMVHSPALSHLMSVMFPPVTSARLEACLSMTTIRQVTTQAMKSGRMGLARCRR
ncbi:hypothetical protein C0Q70_12189 [Pomacea canaliculata]|uniref:Uncharacterized protein n=1 Tax=Pomacea canaliculata TaxID=400727 RepID=A0A2T7P0W7_POMCA|nr:hypothetical protein C0Q70_12189 [Pomacea canaliculata]